MNERRVNFLLGEINRNLDNKKSRQETVTLEEERTQAYERQNSKIKEQSRTDSIAARMMEQHMALRTSSERPERYNPELERNRQNMRLLPQRQYQREYYRS